jgi:hypothetical protein
MGRHPAVIAGIPARKRGHVRIARVFNHKKCPLSFAPERHQHTLVSAECDSNIRTDGATRNYDVLIFMHKNI